jgi:hypothetical protein
MRSGWSVLPKRKLCRGWEETIEDLLALYLTDICTHISNFKLSHLARHMAGHLELVRSQPANPKLVKHEENK